MSLPTGRSPLEAPERGLSEVLAALKRVRVNVAGLDEFSIRDLLAATLRASGIECSTEVRFAPRCRADIWVDGIVIEVKKQRPPSQSACRQVERYAATGKVRAVILALERHMDLPDEIHGIPCLVFSLNSRWGVAV